MRLSRDEYALVNYVHTWAGYPGGSRPGWCDRTLSQKAAFIGVTERGLTKMQNRMIDATLIEKDPLTSHVRATKVWFEIIHDAKVEESKKATLLKEQSSVNDREQSSSKTGNKVPQNGEQSSVNPWNKVPIHNKGFLFNPMESDKEDIIEIESPVETIVGLLNRLTGSSFRTKTEGTIKAINARLSDKYTVDDILLVVEYKVEDWINDPEMSKYLQPSTLFRPSHFENYFQAAQKWKAAGKPKIVKNGKFPSSNNGRVGADVKESTSGAFN